MARLHKLIEKARANDGMTLVEVIVAMLVFAVISLGVGYSTVTIIKMTDDNRARQIATNLAVTEVDNARGLQDPFLVTNGTSTVPVGNRTFTVVRSVSWVTADGTDVACGTGTGTMQSKRLNVEVTWNNMLTTTPAVRVDTLISPDERINDPNLGTIRLSVLGIAGTGTSGVGVSVTPTSGGAALKEQPSPTDTDGCSFALKVVPGTYSVTISRSNSVDTNQVASPSKTVTVTAGSSVAAQFSYDYAAFYNLTYSSASGAILPIDLDTTFVSTYGAYVASGGSRSQVLLHPVSSGYAGIAGKYIAPVSGNAGCINVDPASWQAGTVGGKAYNAGERMDNVATVPQGSVNMTIPMGAVTATVPGNNNYLFAVSVAGPSGSGDPGCAAAPTYAFGKVSGSKTIALPYGSWVLYYGSNQSGSNKIVVPANNVGLVGGLLGSVTSILGLGGATITLDPRVAK